MSMRQMHERKMWQFKAIWKNFSAIYSPLNQWDWSLQCPQTRFCPSNIPLSKQPSKTQSQIETEVLKYTLPNTRTIKRRALSIQEVELDDWFLNLHIVLVTYTTYFMHEFRMSYVLHFISIFLNWRLEFEPTLQLKAKI